MSRLLLALTVLAVASLVVRADDVCGTNCQVNSDCSSSTCAYCMQGKCGAGCSQDCSVDADCLDANCKYCVVQTGETTGQCGHSPLHTCGQPCSVQTDCDQSGSCKRCENGVCTAGCGQQCETNGDCLGKCRNCLNNICSTNNVTCDHPCSLNSDCDQTSDCKFCMQGQCGAGCMMNCTMDAGCRDPNCGVCTEGICQHEKHDQKCHQPCIADADCDGNKGKTCNFCVQGKCGAPCATPCVMDSDCITPNCGKCAGGQCTSGVKIAP